MSRTRREWEIAIHAGFTEYDKSVVREIMADWKESEERISDTPILSAVPSVKCKEIIKQTGEMFDLFKEENIGRYELTQARVALFKASDYLEEFERRRGIAR